LAGLAEKIDHIVVLMLENRSFDCILGKLRPSGVQFNGLRGNESNSYSPSAGATQQVASWNDPTLVAGAMTIPDPDPGELLKDMNSQLFGLGGTPNSQPPPMSGFVDNYMRQPPADKPFDPKAPMHHYTPDQLPVISLLAQSFALCDQWHASAPCQTWPNRFFVHTATAGGYANNSPPHFPYLMPSIFRRLESVGRRSHIYFHDVPQSITLADQWLAAPDRFRPIECFWDDAEHGDLPDYVFIEPRYFTDNVLGLMPNDQHPPHDVVYGEQLIARVYNAVRSSPAWKKILFVLTFDEHGGCYDHVPPPAAVPPEPKPGPDGFLFDRYGVRVPAIIISPYTKAGTVLRNADVGSPRQPTPSPFDHTSIIRTLRQRFDPNGAPLSCRDASAPSLDSALNLNEPANDGPDRIEPPAYAPTADEIQRAKNLPPNDLQRSLCALSARLPRPGADVLQHIDALRNGLIHVLDPVQECVADAAGFVKDNLASFLG
jgi:phospholipase C